MTQSEYKALIDFLSRKFDGIDGRFEAIEGRLEAVEGRLTRLEVGAEDLRHQIRIVAEGVVLCNERIDRNARLIQELKGAA
jgi:chromosome segregation ATPase